MGIKTVALYPTEKEKDQFLETRFADESYCLEENGVFGYLNQKKIIQIAKRSGAQAIHPGYGFLAENGNFSDLCKQNDIKFIGPSGWILRMLGNKIEAKKIAKSIGLPLLPGSDIAVKDEKSFLRIANQLKPPFLLKAANGGGGVGIREITEENEKDILEIFRQLQRETKSAFDSDEIFVEKFLKDPRHIEFQILGDGTGKVLHFGERECSIQRRHQKLIEESPSPFLDEKTREKMAKLCVRFGERLKYESLGTIEFLIGQDKRYYFLEVNPRLQVEHPVTELTTGIDLVEKQIRIANGERIGLNQKDIKFSGWAMEFRIYAENAANNFLPHEGIITNYFVPGGKGIEIHSFCQQNQRIFPYFDSLISKLVVYAKSRQRCIKRAKRAFEEYLIEGVPTLIPFYQVLLDNPKFIAGSLSTSFIESEKILDLLKGRKEEIKVAFNNNNGEIKKEELAKIIAHLYLELKKEKPAALEVSKWKMFERIKLLEDQYGD